MVQFSSRDCSCGCWKVVRHYRLTNANGSADAGAVYTVQDLNVEQSYGLAVFSPAAGLATGFAVAFGFQKPGSDLM